MIKTRTLKIFGIAIIAIFIANCAVLSYADENIYDLLQRDGKLRLIVRFKGFVADRISFKLGDGDIAEDNDLNEYILQKIDQKYNLKKLERLIKDREQTRTSVRASQEFDDYYVIEIDKDEESAGWVADRLQRFYEVDMAEVDREVEIAAYPLPDVDYIPNDYWVTRDNIYWSEVAYGWGYPDMWGLKKTQAFEAWDLFGSPRTDPGKDVVVAVIDTGVNYGHSDLGGCKWINTGEVAGNNIDDDGNGYVDDMNGWDFVNNDNNPYDGHGHGTHCSGTIAAATNNARGIAGMAPNAKIMALKGLSDGGSGYISWLSNCVIYATDNGADVLSNSWGGGGSSSTLTNAMNYAYSRGCVIVAAAGNSNTNVSGFQPANIANVIAVAATDFNDIRAYFSNYGAMIDVSAPGVRILSTTENGYSAWQGTSMACPHVAGIAALIVSKEPMLTNAQVRQRLRDTADNIDSRNPSYRGLLGTGRVNAYEAILAGGPVNHDPVLNSIGNRTVDEGDTLSFAIYATDADGDPLIYSVFDEMPGGLVNSGHADFFIQSNTVYEGTRALQSGQIANREYTTVSKSAISLSEDGSVSFYWKVSSAPNCGKLAFFINDVKRAEIGGDVDWREESFNLIAGTYTLKWTYSKDCNAAQGADAGWIDKISILSGGTRTYDFEDGNIPDGFTVGGDGEFYVQSEDAYDSSYALMADQSIVDNESVYIKTTYTPPEDATQIIVSFWWKVSSEYYYDYLEWYEKAPGHNNDVLNERISGTTGWQRVSYNIAYHGGSHTFTWKYRKDYSVSRGQDTGWIDDIVIGSDKSGTEVIDFESSNGEPNPLPGGASFNAGNRTFTWTPTKEQAGTYPGIRFTVTEDTETAESDYEDITITVNDVNEPPVLDPIGNKSVNEMGLLEFIISATDPEGDTLTFGASSLPEGAVFDSDTQTFTWTPTYQQAGMHEGVRFTVGDGASVAGASGGEVAGSADANAALLLNLNDSFTDSSASGHTATSHGDASIDTSTKKFGSGSLKLDGSYDYLTLPDSDDWDISTDFTLDFWVKHASFPRGVEYIIQQEDGGNFWQVIHVQGHGIRFQLASNGRIAIDTGYGGEITDTDWHHVALCKTGSHYGVYRDGVQVNYTYDTHEDAFSGILLIGAYIGGAYFDGHMDEIRITQNNYFEASPNNSLTDTITMPTGEDGGEDDGEGDGTTPGGNTDSEDITITVINVNYAPVLSAIGNKTVAEGETLEYTLTATDINGDTLTYSATNLPTGASFDTSTHTFSWVPTYDQAGTYLNILFQVSDGSLTDSEEMTITVSNVNAPPVLGSIGDKTVDEGALLEFTITATDSDEDALSYQASNLPTGASFNTQTRVFSWTPTYTDAGTYSTVTFTVSDGTLTDEEVITITVSNVNRKPVISGLTITPTNATIAEGDSITIAIDASDADGDSLSYSVQNGPDGSGFVNNDFYWAPGYDQAETYSDITFVVYDGLLYSDPSESVTITVTNANDAPSFIAAPTVVASYTADGEAKDVKVDGDYAYVANGSSGFNVLDISDLTNITKADSLSSYSDLSKIMISGVYAYAIDSGNSISIIKITDPSMLSARGDIVESGAMDISVYGDTAYISCGSSMAIYDVADKDYPEEITGYDLGRSGKLVIKGDYGYSFSADDDLKIIDMALNETLSTTLVSGAAGDSARDMAVSGNEVYVAKDSYGIVAFDAEDLLAPVEDGEYTTTKAMKEIETLAKNYLFAIGYGSIYELSLLDITDPASITESWSYSFASATTVNSLHADGNRLFIANQDGLDIIISPLESAYTIETESEFKLTIYAEDPDEDTLTYTMTNKPGFAEAVFTDNGDGTATFTWTPTEAQIGTYEDITLTVTDEYQEVTSDTIRIAVVQKDTPTPAIDENTKLLLHLNQADRFTDSSLSSHTVMPHDNADIDDSTAKFGTGSLLLDGSYDYLTLPDSDDWDISTDFTLDFWVKHASFPRGVEYIIQQEDGGNFWQVIHVQGHGIRFQLASNGRIAIDTGYGGEITDTDWHHVALCKTGSHYGVYRDGVQVNYTYDTHEDAFSGILLIGAYIGGAYFDGHMDEIRITQNNYFEASPNAEFADAITVPTR